MRGARGLLRGVWLLLVSLGLTLFLILTALFIMGIWNVTAEYPNWKISVREMADELSVEGDTITLSPALAERMRQQGNWAMLLDDDGNVIWSQDKPADIPDRFTAGQIAGFTHWFLQDYPINVWVYGDGLAVLAWPKGSEVKYNASFAARYFDFLLRSVPVLFLVICCALLLYARRSFRKEQARRDAARARWIDGVSHDIRTPLSVIMGYAGAWISDPGLPGQRRTEAVQMVNACTSVKTLVSDLNLTMRLDYEMQPHRREKMPAAALLRAAAAEALNNGLLEEIELETTPEQEAIILNVDGALVHRALMNLLQNAKRHGGQGAVRLSLRRVGRRCALQVCNPCAEADACAKRLSRTTTAPAIAPDGSAAHGTGLYLVRQVARAHGGKLIFRADKPDSLCAELVLPCVKT